MIKGYCYRELSGRGSDVNGGIYVSYKKLSIISYPSIRLRALHVIRFVYVVVVGVIFGFSFVFYVNIV